MLAHGVQYLECMLWIKFGHGTCVASAKDPSPSVLTKGRSLDTYLLLCIRLFYVEVLSLVSVD